jgi:outer membrane protein TolC
MMTRERSLRLAAPTLLAAIAVATPARAAEEPAQAMTLNQALDYARAHQPSLRAAMARVAALRADADVARSQWYPAVTGTAQLFATTTNNTTGSYVSVPGFDNPRVSATKAEATTTATLVPEPSTLVGAGIRQTVFDFGRIGALAAAADLRADVERAALAAVSLRVDYAVEEAYFAVSAAHAVQTASDQAYARSVVHRDLARAGVESGMRRPIELTRAEATLDRYDLGRIHARRGVALAESLLAAVVGIPEARLDVSGPPPSPPGLPPLADVLGAAADHSPDLLVARARVRAQEGATRAVEREARPTLFVSGALSGNAGGAAPSSGFSAVGSGLLPLVPNWDAGVVLAWPLFDATVRARADRSRAEEDVSREEAEVERQRIVSAVEQAYTDVEAARAALPVLRHQTDAAVANYQQASARFDAGMSNAVELADAEEIRTDAEIQLALGTFELTRTQVALWRLAGRAP